MADKEFAGEGKLTFYRPASHSGNKVFLEANKQDYQGKAGNGGSRH